MKKVEDISVEEKLTADDLVKQMHKSGGFTAKKLADSVDILEEMAKDKKCVRFLSFPACIIATGTRGVIKELVKNKLVDVVITTCGTLDHDLARTWQDYYHGSFMLDDKELNKKGINRLGNVLVPNESYGIVLEKKLQPIFESIGSENQRMSTRDLIWEVGKRLENEEKKENSIIYWAYKNKIPVFVPGITDGAFGFQLFMFWQDHKEFIIDLMKDEEALSDISFNAGKTGALIIGGGISKHHTIWWNQFRGGLDYAVYVTTAPEYDGSLSGARVREAISWGKVKEEARYVTVEGDATVLLPFMISSLFERVNKNKN